MTFSPTFQPKLTSIATQVLEKRYLIRNEDGSLAETPTDMFKRVAIAIAGAEDAAMQDYWAERFYSLMASRVFLPNTPTLVNAGRPGGTGQYSACFVIPVEDSMEGIFDAVKTMALVHKTGGGTGFAFSRLRAKASFVRRTSGQASGPISFMQVFDAATQHIKQGGVRRGANMGVLRVDHPDILDFIEMKARDESVMQNFNVSVGITNAFMEALASDDDRYWLVDHRGKQVSTLHARDVWRRIAECAHVIGDPGLVFLDRVNELDPLSHNDGMAIEATNPCGEVPLRPYDACTLGSINVAGLDLSTALASIRSEVLYPEPLCPVGPVAFTLEEVVITAVRFLDNVLTLNNYPHPEIRRVTSQTRKVGLGLMGLADCLIASGIPYASEEGRSLAAKIMEKVNISARWASQDLAVERGAYPLFPLSKDAAKRQVPLRNSTRTVIAPTGSISIIAGCSGGIEPLFALSQTRNQAGMTMHDTHPVVSGLPQHVVDAVIQHGMIPLDEPHLPDSLKSVLRVAGQIDPTDHILMQAAVQQHTDDAVSKTINMPNSATVQDVLHAYELAWSSGCKGITVYRDGCRTGQVLTLGTAPPLTTEAPPAVRDRRRVPANGVRTGSTVAVETAYGTVHVTINDHPSDGQPFETFISMGKAGSEIFAWCTALGRVISGMLSIPSAWTPRERMEFVAEQLQHIGGGETIGLGARRVRSVPDAIAQAMLTVLYPPGTDGAVADDPPVPSTAVSRGVDLCPSCNFLSLVRSSGCQTCGLCGFSKC